MIINKKISDLAKHLDLKKNIIFSDFVRTGEYAASQSNPVKLGSNNTTYDNMLKIFNNQYKKNLLLLFLLM